MNTDEHGWRGSHELLRRDRRRRWRVGICNGRELLSLGLPGECDLHPVTCLVEEADNGVSGISDISSDTAQCGGRCKEASKVAFEIGCHGRNEVEVGCVDQFNGKLPIHSVAGCPLSSPSPHRMGRGLG